MASTIIELEGTAMWAKLFERNKDTNEDYHGPGGAYTVDMVLESDQLKKLSSAGSRLKPRVTDEGMVVKLKRKHDHKVADFGGAPVVKDAEGEVWDDSVSIGNGSKIKAAVSIYDTKMGKGTRLVGIQVLDLEEYEGDGEGEPQSEKDRLPF